MSIDVHALAESIVTGAQTLSRNRHFEAREDPDVLKAVRLARQLEAVLKEARAGTEVDIKADDEGAWVYYAKKDVRGDFTHSVRLDAKGYALLQRLWPDDE